MLNDFWNKWVILILQLVAMANMEVTVYTNAVRIVGMARYVTRCMDIVPPVNLGFKGFSVMKVRIANFTFSLLRSPEYKTIKCLMYYKNKYYVGTLFAYDSLIIHKIQFTQHYDQSNNTLLHFKVPRYHMLGPTTCIYTFRSRNSNVIEHLKSCRT